ncbi:tripartite tricarboxylate transporter substrate binding protein [soil metagenome]
MALAPAVGAGTVAAQGAWPSQSIRFIAPTPPAGLVDIVGRLFADKLSQPLGQAVVVDNRPGAAGNIGASYVARAAADGYTLLVGFDGTLVINPSVYQAPGFDTAKDFAPITKLAEAGLLLVANPSVGASNLKELLARARAAPDKPLAYATSGIGSTPHICGELLAQRAGIHLTHVPYKGGGQAMADVIAGQLPLCITALATAAPHLKAGKLVALGVSSAARVPALPALPTFQEAGLNGFVMTSWVGMLAPAKTPREVIERLHREFIAALARPDTRERLQLMGMEAVGNSPEEFAAQIRADLERYARVVKAAKITAEG